MVKVKDTFKILIIEDNVGDYVLVEEFLLDEFELPETVHAQRFSEAEKLLKSETKSFDAILLDLTLPDKSGEELVDEILTLAEEVPVIVLTGYTDLDFSVLSLSKGVSDYLLKDDLTPPLLKKSILYGIERAAFASKIKKSEKNYRDLFEFSPEPMWIYDLETLEFFDVNQAAIKHYGFSKEEFMNMIVRDIRPPDAQAQMEESIRETIRYPKKKYIGVNRHWKKSGEIIQVEIESSAIEYEGRDARLILARDITDKLKEEERLKLLESVITNAKEYVIIQEPERTDLPGRKILYVNEAFTRITGYEADEVLGKTVHFLNGEKTSQNELNKLYDAMNNWEMCEVEFLNYKKDGTTFWARTSLVPVADGKGGYSHWVAIGRDISEQKRYESQLTESLKEKDVLLSEIHHRVKNNLAVVSGMMQLQVFEEENTLVQEKLNDSIFRIHTMATIHEILYQSGSFSKLHFSDIAEQLANKISSVTGIEKEIEVKINKASIQLNINQAIPASLILNEILTNAYKHAFKGRDKGIILIKISEKKNEILIKVEDNGVGISSDRKNIKSLGLNIVEILTQQLHGKHKVYDTGSGTAFELSFSKSDAKGTGSALIR